MAGIVAGGGDAADVPIYTTEPEALQAELNGAAGAGATADDRTLRGSSS